MKRIKNWVAKRLFSLLSTKNYIKSNSIVSFPDSASVFGNLFDGEVEIGRNSKVIRTECYGEIKIGHNSALNGPNLNIYAGLGKVSIGNFCSIARNVSIQLEGHNYKKVTTYQIFKNLFDKKNESEIVSSGDIIIGNDVWIGANAMVYGGVTIGDGAVVGSNCFVNKDVPPYAIVVGSPAKIIKFRFDDQIIEILNKLKWWDWDEETLKRNEFLFEDELSVQTLEKIKL